MVKRSKKPEVISAHKVHSMEWRFEPRTASEILGTRQYATPEQALRELVANGFNAGAKTIRIDVQENKMLGIDSITVSDNGEGMNLSVIRDRFVAVGTLPSTQSRAGRFGIGRLAVHRLGRISHWTTVTQEEAGRRRYTFSLRSDAPTKTLLAKEEIAKRGEKAGTRIEIREVLDDRGLTEATIGNDLLQHFCGLLLAEPDLQIYVNDNRIEVQSLVETTSVKCWNEPKLGSVVLRHVLLKRKIDTSRFAGQLVYTTKGREINRFTPAGPVLPNYLAVIECAKLEDFVTTQREGLIQLDSGFENLRRSVEREVQDFRANLISGRKANFINTARSLPYYPFPQINDDPVKKAEQEVYDVVLGKLNDELNIGGMPAKQQRVLFSLLKRALVNENLIEVLAEITNLSDEDIAQFREVLERTTLDSIIRLSSEATQRLDFLDHLHNLVYSDTAKYVKERSHLHVILEPHCWLFGPQFHLATSDQNFRSVIAAHRVDVGLAKLPEADVNAIDGVRDIPDLFLVASREYPVSPRHHNLLVELKAPKVEIGTVQHAQGLRYAQTVSKLPSVANAHWDVFLVSSEVSEDIALLRSQQNKPFGLVVDTATVRLWVFTWAELIEQARTELGLVRDNLRRKSRQLHISDLLKEKFPDVLTEIEQRVAKGSSRDPDEPSQPMTEEPCATSSGEKDSSN